MTASNRHDGAVRLRFGDCDESVVVRTILAAADHLCGAADISMALLDALEVPLAEGLEALHSAAIDSAVVSVVEEKLTVGIGVRQALAADSTEVFGSSYEMVTSFFAVDRGDDQLSIGLSGSLR